MVPHLHVRLVLKVMREEPPNTTKLVLHFVLSVTPKNHQHASRPNAQALVLVLGMWSENTNLEPRCT